MANKVLTKLLPYTNPEHAVLYSWVENLKAPPNTVFRCLVEASLLCVKQLIKGKVRQTQLRSSLLVSIKLHVSAYSEAFIRFTVLETTVCVWQMLRSHHRAYTHEI